MKTNYNIEEEIYKTMNSWSEEETPKLNPYFTAKLKARIESETSPNPVLNTILKWAFAVIILIINSYTIFSYVNSDTNNNQNTYYSAIESEYSVDATDLYADNTVDYYESETEK